MSLSLKNEKQHSPYSKEEESQALVSGTFFCM